jgi:hypothetical protein
MNVPVDPEIWRSLLPVFSRSFPSFFLVLLWVNFAVGCVGERMATARIVDTLFLGGDVSVIIRNCAHFPLRLLPESLWGRRPVGSSVCY